jgi:hypothetical protein
VCVCCWLQSCFFFLSLPLTFSRHARERTLNSGYLKEKGRED